MNENFKLSRSAQNDLESVHIGPRSVPAKCQVLALYGVLERNYGSDTFSQFWSPQCPRFLYQFGDSKLEDERQYQAL